MKDIRIDRRGFLKGSLGSLAACTGLSAATRIGMDQAQDDRYLFVIAAPGGASMNDCFLASNEGPAAYSYDLLVKPEFTPLRCVIPSYNSVGWSLPIGNGYSQLDFLTAHHQNIAVIGVESATLDRTYAPRLAMTGNEINGGRTIAEHVAASYRGRYVLPNVSMAAGEFAAPGTDLNLSDAARAEVIADPLMFAFATHGHLGLKTGYSSRFEASAKAQIERQLRLSLEKNSAFYEAHRDHHSVRNYQYNREVIMAALENNQLMAELLIDGTAKERYRRYGLKLSPDFQRLSGVFGQLGSDPFEAQMALAFLLTQKGLTNTVTMAPSTDLVMSRDQKTGHTAPMGFNWSHTDHRAAQNTMWSYLLKNIDSLITLLKAEDIDGDPSKGKMWDKSVIYITTEFGRDRVQFGGSRPHANNAHVIISPLVNGNRLYGSYDEKSGWIGGFNPVTGAPDPGRLMTTGDLYSIVADLMGAPFAGQRSLPAIKKA